MVRERFWPVLLLRGGGSSDAPCVLFILFTSVGVCASVPTCVLGCTWLGVGACCPSLSGTSELPAAHAVRLRVLEGRTRPGSWSVSCFLVPPRTPGAGGHVEVCSPPTGTVSRASARPWGSHPAPHTLLWRSADSNTAHTSLILWVPTSALLPRLPGAPWCLRHRGHVGTQLGCLVPAQQLRLLSRGLCPSSGPSPQRGLSCPGEGKGGIQGQGPEPPPAQPVLAGFLIGVGSEGRKGREAGQLAAGG